jgi:hypothetical protein
MKLFRKILAFLIALILGPIFFFVFPLFMAFSVAWKGVLDLILMDSYWEKLSNLLSSIRGN